MQQEQLLRQQIMSSKEWMVGSTPAGADWCIKALHPSDPMTQVRGIPDMSSATSLCMNYQTTYSLSPRTGATGTWSFDATLLPHPINFMAIQTTDSVAEDTHVVLNSQISGADHAEKAAWLAGNAQQWRLAYAGVTITQDGPDLANQGTCVVAQAPVAPYKFFASALDATSGQCQAAQPVEVYTPEDMPSYTASQAMPSAFFDNSKKGVYVPLKLTKTCQTWRSQTDMVGTGADDQLTEGVYAFPTSEDYAWPHWDLPCTRCVFSGPSPQKTTTVSLPKADSVNWSNFVTSPMLNDVMAHISFRNLAVTTSFALFFRYGIEMRVQPASALSPQLELSPRYDARALETYFAISRELKDGYEAKFNDLGKLWQTISGVAKNVLPTVSQFGPLGSAVSTAVGGVVGLGDAIHSQRSQSRASQKNRRKNNRPGSMKITPGKRGPRRMTQGPPQPPRNSAV